MINYFSTIELTPIFIVNLIVAVCIFSIFLAVLLNFLDDKGSVHKPKKQKKSIVETGTMTLFFILVYFLLRFRVGSFEQSNWLSVGIGLMVMVFGTFFNIWGRKYLGDNWANQIKIYDNHKLVTGGPYKFVRHPLYASLIWMFYASSFIYANWAVFIVTTVIFVPFMYYRAKQEEKLLTQQFEEYKIYAKKTGMFFPKILK
jgi:protein-S-isoprenylcysteine O-methyltransferase Ste14